MNSIVAMVLVMAGGFGGGVARLYLSGLVAEKIGGAFPLGTLLVNFTGCLLVGMLAGLARSQLGPFEGEWFIQLAVTGFCGGFTTVSTFCFQTLELGLDGHHRLAAANVVASVLLCLAAVGVGYWAVGAMALGGAA